ncbi:MAG: hypothetical protein WBD01_08345 [Salaquimonas sp.]
MEFANNYEELSSLVNDDVKFAKSAEQFLEIVNSQDLPPYLEESVALFKRATVEELKNFSETLEFKEGMLGHANYEILAKYLEGNENMKIWEIFGIGNGIALDAVDYYCRLGGASEPNQCLPYVGLFCGSLVCQN